MHYRCIDQVIGIDSPQWQSTLGSMHANKLRPLCMCMPDGVAMVVFKRDGMFGVRRMPDGGETHSPQCDSYEPPSQLSGLGQVLGHAIKENAEDGTATLNLAFALTKRGNRPPPPGSGVGSDVIKSEAQKLTILALLHYLWDEAEFTKWTPNMLGRRGWGTIYKYLSAAVAAKYTKGQDLASQIFIPEPWDSEKKDVIVQARKARMIPLTKSESGHRQLMIMVAELKEIKPGRYGSKLIFKHLPELPFFIDSGSLEASQKRFENLYALWDTITDSHMICICTFGLGASGVATIEQHSLMLVNESWIPFEHAREAELLALLRERRFVKSLRYNLSKRKPLSFAVLQDTGEKPTAMYIGPDEVQDEFTAELKVLLESDQVHHWVWDSGALMPILPQAL